MQAPPPPSKSRKVFRNNDLGRDFVTFFGTLTVCESGSHQATSQAKETRFGAFLCHFQYDESGRVIVQGASLLISEV